MKIGDRVFVRGYIDEICKDTVIIRNAGGYFGTIPSEVTVELPSAQQEIIRCKDCKYYTPVTAHCEIRGKGLYLIRGMEDFCSRAERRADE